MLLLYYMCDINNGIISHLPVYLCTLTLLFPDVVLVSDLNKIVWDGRIWQNRHGLADLLTPIHSGPLGVKTASWLYMRVPRLAPNIQFTEL